MRSFTLLVLLPLLFDVTPAGSLKKLAGKKTYAFEVETRVDGDLDPGGQVVSFDISGAFARPDLTVAQSGGMKLVRKGSAAMVLVEGKWKMAADVKNERLVKLGLPHEEIARRAAALAPLKVKLTVGDVECDVFRVELSKEESAEMATELLNGATMRNGSQDVPENHVPPETLEPTPIKPRDAKASIKLMIDPEEELPRQLIREVTFKAGFAVAGGKVEEREITITRTTTLSQFDEATLEIPDEVRKKLGIAEK